jgi:glutaredoxin
MVVLILGPIAVVFSWPGMIMFDVWSLSPHRLLAWWKKRPGDRLAHLHFVLYTRSNCHLCERARDCLSKAQLRHGIVFSVKDIDTDPELVRAYGNCVPVVTVNGKLRFRGTVNEVMLNRLLRANIPRTRASAPRADGK